MNDLTKGFTPKKTDAQKLESIKSQRESLEKIRKQLDAEEGIIKSRTYTITMSDYVDTEGTKKQRLLRVCDGFTALELLGVVEFCRSEIVEQIKGTIKPDIIKREAHEI